MVTENLSFRETDIVLLYIIDKKKHCTIEGEFLKNNYITYDPLTTKNLQRKKHNHNTKRTNHFNSLFWPLDKKLDSLVIGLKSYYVIITIE